ncbi:hypothetical protein CHS0354_035245 [Potamilus streckersoni]|uniref:Phenylalanine--tRNA ligase beta subunit n=1 Tax=Potamilus streckersoni TaxID=2493646 RepID=A0AAE0S2Y9_9BIVA|nr:hypothetical protein CHS0354_035245 [Potamilus streckersoni]
MAELYPDMLDCILTIDNKSVTHRPDLWGHYGFAREFSAVFDSVLKPYTQKNQLPKGNGTAKINICIDKETQAKRFTSTEVTGLRVAPSPSQMRHRLYRVGSKAINNLVDITNYVMLDCGQPMHAFDAGQIPGNKLDIRRAQPGETLHTLQHKTVSFTPEDVVICDGNGVTATAGIIGGERSGINVSTSEILLKQDAGTPSASGIHPYASIPARKHRNAMKNHQGDLFDFRTAGNPSLPVIELNKQHIDRLLGITTSDRENTKILTKLGFGVNKTPDGYSITVPSWRATKDVSIPEDLIEEIGRMYGYNNIAETPPLFPIEKPAPNQQRLFERAIKYTLASCGMLEVFTYPMNARADELKLEFDSIRPNELLNPVVSQWHQMRTVILPGFLNAVQEGQKTDIRFSYFELGKIYGKRADNTRYEDSRLFLSFSSDEKPEILFQNVKRTINRLFSTLGLKPKWTPAPSESLKSYMHPHRSASVSTEGKLLGTVFTFTRLFMNDHDLNGNLFMAEFDADLLFSIHQSLPVRKLGELPKYPAVPFDISVLVNRTDSYGFFADLISAVDRRVERVDYVYEYVPPETPDKKSLTMTVTFRDPEKTLDAEEAKNLRDKIVSAIEKNGYRLK